MAVENIYFIAYLIGVISLWGYVGIIVQYSKVIGKFPKKLILKKLLFENQNIDNVCSIILGTIFVSVFWPVAASYYILKSILIIFHIGKVLAVIIRKTIWLLLPNETKAQIALGTQKQDD